MGRPPKWCRAYVYVGEVCYCCERPNGHDAQHRFEEMALAGAERVIYRLVVEWPHEGEQQP